MLKSPPKRALSRSSTAIAISQRPHIAALDADVREAIAKHGIRNGCLTSIAPTGTISLFAGNISSGIEPVFDFRMRRRILDSSGSPHEELLEDFAYARLSAPRRRSPYAS